MGHIQRVDRALTVAGYKLHAYIDNDHVFGVDVLAAEEDKYGVQVFKPVGHAVFAPSKRKDRPGFLFVEGRIGEDRFAAIGKTPARALWEFETHVAEKIFA
jgi:hypothetical protein